MGIISVSPTTVTNDIKKIIGVPRQHRPVLTVKTMDDQIKKTLEGDWGVSPDNLDLLVIHFEDAILHPDAILPKLKVIGNKPPGIFKDRFVWYIGRFMNDSSARRACLLAQSAGFHAYIIKSGELVEDFRPEQIANE